MVLPVTEEEVISTAPRLMSFPFSLSRRCLTAAKADGVDEAVTQERGRWPREGVTVMSKPTSEEGQGAWSWLEGWLSGWKEKGEVEGAMTIRDGGQDCRGLNLNLNGHGGTGNKDVVADGTEEGVEGAGEAVTVAVVAGGFGDVAAIEDAVALGVNGGATDAGGGGLEAG